MFNNKTFEDITENINKNMEDYTGCIIPDIISKSKRLRKINILL